MKGIDLFGENGRKRETKIKIFQKDINSLRLVWFQLANFMVLRRSFIKNDNELLCFTKGGGERIPTTPSEETLRCLHFVSLLVRHDEGHISALSAVCLSAAVPNGAEYPAIPTITHTPVLTALQNHPARNHGHHQRDIPGH